MAIHTFTYEPKRNEAGVISERSPIMDRDVYVPDFSETASNDFYDLQNRDVIDVRTNLSIGFHTMDNGLKQWLSNIIIPTGDSTKELTVRIAGGDKTFLFWKQDLTQGRIKLPVCSINRTSWKFNEQKFSPPHHPMATRLLNRDGRKIKATYRPWPALIDYSLSIWTEYKRDMEYITHQIVTRFHPLGEFRVEDEFLRGTVQCIFNGMSNNSDIDIGADEKANVRYDLEMTLEGWLPLSEKIAPTVLGQVAAFHEFTGSFLDLVNFKNRTAVGGGFFKSIGVENG